MNKSRSPKRKTTHPGEILSRDVLPAAGLDVRSAAKILEVSEEHLQSVLDCKAPVTKELARKLGAWLKNSPEFWENLQNAHDLSMLEAREKGHLAKEGGRKPKTRFRGDFMAVVLAGASMVAAFGELAPVEQYRAKEAIDQARAAKAAAHEPDPTAPARR